MPTTRSARSDRSQDHLLGALWEQDGRTPGEIAAATNVTTPAVTKAAARMVEAEGCG